ncbi:sodium:proton antiporter [Acuticoccus sp. MNP-M23]|uniref:cation:proton antiporter n=1 Tax=Acuticoccus sp. MNP-M23 TaxID=3072793 RepID=UPI002814B55E|nr:sodium:proton antiporter [Acuticoccus sp. MNP-M23]WMS43705.1 sodium:proton antiporter [Acuticoccus sp. MNP-M23]
MNPSDLLILAGAVLAFSLLSKKAEDSLVTPPMAFAALGVVVSGAGLGLIELPATSALIHALAEITLILTLFTDASRIDVTELSVQHAIPIRLLLIGLPLAIIAGTGAAWLLFPALGLWGAAILGVILAPTDAALGQSVVANPRVPQRIRQAINVESGLNDGLAFPALLVVAALAQASVDKSTADFVTFAALQILLGPAAGVFVGWAGSWAAEKALAHDWMAEIYLKIGTLALPLVAYGGAELIGGNGFIAAFACGLVVAARSNAVRAAAGAFGEAEGQLLTLIVFTLFGAILLPDIASDVGWRHLLYAVLSLTVLRMVPVALSLVGAPVRPVTVLFIGWFGPRGLASIIYLLLVLEEYDVGDMTDVKATVILTVALSIILHGISASPLAKAYGANADEDHPESRPLKGFALRLRSHGGKKHPR